MIDLVEQFDTYECDGYYGGTKAYTRDEWIVWGDGTEQGKGTEEDPPWILPAPSRDGQQFYRHRKITTEYCMGQAYVQEYSEGPIIWRESCN